MSKKLNFGEIVKKTEEPKYPVRNLLVVPHKRKRLIVTLDAFGGDTYLNNLREMKKTYPYPNSWEEMSFRGLTTSESISAAAYKFPTRAKKIFDYRFLQAGYVLRTAEGVWVNPLDEEGNPIIDESALKEKLKNFNKIKVRNGHIYLGRNDFGFAEYETFEQGIQYCDNFVGSGLARVLEHTAGEAKTLKIIADEKNYPWGIGVWGFDFTVEPSLEVARLSSGRKNISGDRLFVGSWADDYSGYAFGKLKTSDASA